jgi:DNA-binding transcriptional LysR family regulator
MPPNLPPSPLSISFDDLRSLIAVIDDVHVGRAAERLRTTESALSDTIRRLENALAVPLVVRRSPEITPTAAGRVFATEARKLISGLELAVAETRRAGGLGATVRIGCVPDLRLERLQSFLGLLYERDPELHAEVTHLRTVEQMRRLRAGELDLGLIHDAGEEDGIETETVFAGVPLTAYLPIGHRLAAKDALGPGDLEGELLLVVPRAADPGLDGRLMALLERAGLGFDGVRETSGDDARDLLFAVAQSHGVAVGPTSALEAAGDVGTLVVARPLTSGLRMPDTLLAWRPGPPAELAVVIDAAREIARELRG